MALSVIIPHVLDVNQRDELNTPLYNASMEVHGEAMRVLIGNGADMNARCPLSCTPLRAAVVSGNPDAVAYLLAKGADPSVAHCSGEALIQLMRSMHGMMSETLKCDSAMQNGRSYGNHMDMIVAIF